MSSVGLRRRSSVIPPPTGYTRRQAQSGSTGPGLPLNKILRYLRNASIVTILGVAALWLWSNAGQTLPTPASTQPQSNSLSPKISNVSPRPPPVKPASDGITGDTLTLVSKAPSEGYDAYNFTYPYEGRLLHFSSAIHPKKSRYETEYELISLWFVEDPVSWPNRIQGHVVDDWAKYVFTCHFGDETYPARVEEQARWEYLLIHCNLPAFAEDLQKQVSAKQRIAAFRRMQNTPKSIKVWYPAQDETQPNVLLTEARLDMEAPQERAYLGACVSPLRFGEDTSLTDLLEWRVYNQLQGMESVSWYSRQMDFQPWVAQLNAKLGVQDTFHYAPSVYEPMAWQVYHDQIVWYADCFLRAGHNIEWTSIVDVDEYITLRGSEATRVNGVADYLRSKDPGISSLTTWQSYYGGERTPNTPTVKDFPYFPRNGWSMWTDNYLIQKAVRFVKSIHRTTGLKDFWVHAPIFPDDGWWNEWDEANMTCLHSRRTMYEDMVLHYPVNITDADYTFWNIMAKKLEGLDELYTLSSVQQS